VEAVEADTQAEGERSEERKRKVEDTAMQAGVSTSAGFASLAQHDWHSAVARVLASLSGSVAALGIHILGLVLHSPMQSGTNARLQLHSWFSNSPRIKPLLKADLLPLPMVLSGVELEVVAEVFAGRSSSVPAHDSHLKVPDAGFSVLFSL